MTLTGHISGGQIVLDGPLSLPEGTLVRVEAIDAADDASTLDALRFVEQSGTLNFWNDPAEDVYSLSDGEPV